MKQAFALAARFVGAADDVQDVAAAFASHRAQAILAALAKGRA